MIKISDYNPQWKKEFEKLKSIYLACLNHINVNIEHVGSTAVEGLCAKPIIDVVIIYYEKKDFDTIKTRLEKKDYKYRGDLGITERHVFDYVGTRELQLHHLYVCLSGIVSLENQLQFRDYLLEHEDTAKMYGNIKKDLAKKYENNRSEYCKAKTDFIIDILRKCDFSDDKIEQIKLMNS